MRPSNKVIFSILSWLALFQTPAIAQNQYEKFIDEQLEALCFHTECDWGYLHLNRFIGYGAEGSVHSHSIDLTEGWDYIIPAVCDQDCGDIDLFLYDPNGALVASDTSVQRYQDFSTTNAEIEITSTSGGAFRIDVKIHSCSTSTCYYGVDVGTAVW